MSVLFTFPGQGAQTPGMLHALPDDGVVAAALAEAADVLGHDPLALDTAAALASTRAVQLCLLIGWTFPTTTTKTRRNRSCNVNDPRRLRQSQSPTSSSVKRQTPEAWEYRRCKLPPQIRLAHMFSGCVPITPLISLRSTTH